MTSLLENYFILLLCQLGFLALLFSPVLNAFGMDEYEIIEGKRIYGKSFYIKCNSQDTLLDIARSYDLGFNQIAAANPGIDPWVPGSGQKILVPKAVMLPDGDMQNALVLNMAEMRLYFFPASSKGTRFVFTCPIGIGRSGYLTRPGLYTIYDKEQDPVWHVPESIRNEEPQLPKEVPPGQDNPLGGFILRFSRLSYGIHGTNKPWGIGRRVSHGCIRLYPEDIRQLFPMVPVGTMVLVIYEPVRACYSENKCWFQVFPDFEGTLPEALATALDKISEHCAGQDHHLDLDLKVIKKTLAEKRGVPVVVGVEKKPKKTISGQH